MPVELRKSLHLGYYATPAEANEVYELAAKMTHGEFYRG